MWGVTEPDSRGSEANKFVSHNAILLTLETKILGENFSSFKQSDWLLTLLFNVDCTL